MIYKVVTNVFCALTAVFLIGGLAIVIGQIAGLVLGNGDVVTSSTELLAPFVYGSAGIAGLLAFVMSYFKVNGAQDENDPGDSAGTLDAGSPDVDVPPGKASGPARA